MNSFGRIFRVEIFGESHGDSVGVIIDGCPPGIKIKPEDFKADLKRRKPGEGKGISKRKESDVPVIKSGVFKGCTTGSPIMIEFENEDNKSDDYKEFIIKPRPGQVDFAAGKKFSGFNDHRGSGHFSARLTVGLVAAGVVAKKIISGIKIESKIVEIGGSQDYKTVLEKAAADGDSLGGIIECSINNLPTGLGEPFFDSFESVVSHIIFAIPSVKGIEFGDGFRAVRMKGSEYNDVLMNRTGKTSTNHCGGITGGLTNGNQVTFRTAFRPPSSISKEMETINIADGKREKLIITGRHDICPTLRACVIVEAAAAISVCDFLMISNN
jgi:chorismate synthase